MDDIQQTERAYPADEPIVELALSVLTVEAPITLEDGFVLCTGGAEQSVQICFAVADLAESVFTERIRGGFPYGIAGNFGKVTEIRDIIACPAIQMMMLCGNGCRAEGGKTCFFCIAVFWKRNIVIEHPRLQIASNIFRFFKIRAIPCDAIKL